jgi:hypothetical protein
MRSINKNEYVLVVTLSEDGKLLLCSARSDVGLQESRPGATPDRNTVAEELNCSIKRSWRI